MEEDIKVQVCRLCFALISDKGFFSIEGSLKVILQVITTDLDLDLTDSPVMCHECSKSVQEMFNFKTNFFESEENIDSKITNLKHKKLNLRDIMSVGSNKESKLKNSELCRTCLETIQGNTFIFLNKNADMGLSSMLDSCLPDLDLNLTSDPVMCQTCYKTLQKMRDFKSVCKKNENQIKAYSRRMCLIKNVDLHSVLKFLANRRTNKSVTKDEENLNSSEEHSELSEGDGEVKDEENLNQSEEHFELSEGDGEVKDEKNLNPSEEHYELKDCPQYVMGKIEGGDEEIVTQQVKSEVKEELPAAENCLEFVMVKMEFTDGDDEIEQDQMELVNISDLKDALSLDTTTGNSVEMESKDKLISRRLQPTRSTKKLRQNRDTNKSQEKNMTQCPNCDFKTNYKYNLKQHRVRVQERKRMISQRKLFQCDKCCFASESSIDLTRHTLSHVKPDALQCSRCAFSTKENSKFIKHVLSHVTAENMDKYSCFQSIKKAQ